MPPAASCIAEYGYKLTSAMREHLRISVVVPSHAIADAEIPRGVSALTCEEAVQGHLDQPDLHVYHVGNRVADHGWMLEAISVRPGIVVLHDLSLFDLYRGLSDGLPELWAKLVARHGYDEQFSQTVVVDGALHPDKMTYSFTQDVIRPSLCTVTHSQWGADHLAALHPQARVTHIPLATDILEEAAESTGSTDGEQPIVALVGGPYAHPRVHIALQAFARAAADRPNARIVIAGMTNNPALVSVVPMLRLLAHDLGIDVKTHFQLDLSPSAFTQLLREARLVVALEWPTVGETSATLVQALGAGRVVLTSAVPQIAEYDDRYVRRVLPDQPNEIGEVAAVMRGAIDDPETFQVDGRAAQEYMRSCATWESVAAAHARLVRHYARTPERGQPPVLQVPGAASDDADSAPVLPHSGGINIHGDWVATTGLAHAGRRLCSALLSQHIPLSIHSMASYAPTDASLLPSEFSRHLDNESYPVDLWTLNIDQFHLVSDELLRSVHTHRYHVATWYWELPSIPVHMCAEFGRIDEIWAPSAFVKRSFIRYTSKPVFVVPTIVPVFTASAEASELRSSFDLPSNAVIFLFTFDLHSTVARKNPLAVVEAFSRAFPHHGPGDPVLVIKAINLDDEPTFKRLLQDAVARVGGRLIDTFLSAQEMADLFHVADVYVSLHRSEGFGLGLAEAMAIGKPVIGTAYSGNMDFMNVGNSCLVGYRLRPIMTRDHLYNMAMASVYSEGALWAEPDLGQAVDWMRLLAADANLRDQIGASARATINAGFTSDVVGRIILARLQELDAQLGALTRVP